MSNPVAVITGAARRIGAALVKTLHQRNFNILLHYNHSEEDAINLARTLNLKRGDSVLPVQANLEEAHAAKIILAALEDKWARCDVLINNASTYYATPLATASLQDWHNLIASNLQAPFFLSQALIPLLVKAKGSIINIADICAFQPKSEHAIYNIAKAGNVMLTKTLALDLAPDVRVNGIAPGAIIWPEDGQGNEIVQPEKLQAIPLQQLGGTESICNTVLFLVENADYISGEIIQVDGGKSLSS